MRNPNVSYDTDVNTTTCDCCGGQVYDDNIAKYQPEKEEEGVPKSLCICETCSEELPEEFADGDWSYIKPEKWGKLVSHCRRMRVLNFIPAVEQINTEQDVREFVDALTNYLVWHPDTPFLDYVDEHGAPLFLEGGDHLKLDLCMERAQEVCERLSKGVDIEFYELSFQSLARHNQGMADAMGRDHKTGLELPDTKERDAKDDADHGCEIDRDLLKTWKEHVAAGETLLGYQDWVNETHDTSEQQRISREESQ
jgi:hypothetical protein